MSAKTYALSPELHQYLLDVSLRESLILKELRNETQKLPDSIMQISPEQGQFMQLLVKLIGARKILEVGVFTGYSTLSMALALLDDGQITACDISEEWTSMARQYWKKAGVDHKIELILNAASDTLEGLINAGDQEKYDLAFIDADKENYDTYYEYSLQLIRPGGLILIDNTLWNGRVLDTQSNDPDTNAIQQLNLKLHSDHRVDISLLPIGDGLTLLRKK